MPELSAEAVLISALINTQNVAGARAYGLVPDHFVGYREHFNWLCHHLETYGVEPSRDVFRLAFPTFSFSEHDDVRSAVDMVFKQVNKRRLTTAMTEAVDFLGVGDIRLAYSTMRVEPLTTAPPPRNLLTDMSFLDTWDEPNHALEVPYSTLQRHTGGIRPGNLWYWAARPGQGKSAHLCNIATRAVLAGARVKFYSLEMSEMEVRFRFHAKLANKWGHKHITLNDLRDRRVDRAAYKEFIGELEERMADTGGQLDIHTPSEGMVTPGVTAATAEEYDLNIVDYIGLMKSDAGAAAITDWRVAAQISNELKLIAGASHSRFLVAAQINREGDAGSGPPKLGQLSQTDALGQDGDVVVTMRAKPLNSGTHLMLEKNRHGASGVDFFTTFEPNIGVFDETTEEALLQEQYRLEDLRKGDA